MYAMTAYSSSGMQSVSMATYAVSPQLLMSASGRLVLRYRQYTNASDVPIAITGYNNVSSLALT
jgi:hypothetical protein